MTLRSSLFLVAGFALALSTLASCAAQPTQSDEPEVSRVWHFESVDAGAQMLAETETELDSTLIDELGIDEALGLSPAEAAGWLPRLGDAESVAVGGNRAAPSEGTIPQLSASVIPADYYVPQPDSETIGAATGSLSMLHEVFREALGEASVADTHNAERSRAEGANPSVRWTVESGVASGDFLSTVTKVTDEGDTLAVSLDGVFETMVCPNADGTAEGAFATTAAITFTPVGGTPTRTSVEFIIDTITHVNDDAHARDLWARVDASLRTGDPHPESATRVPDPDEYRGESNAYGFEFDDTGVQDRGTLTADKQLDGAFSAQVDDLAEQISLLMGRAAEDYWRDGNCVDVAVVTEDATPRPGEKQQLWVEPVSAVDGEPITNASVELIEVLGDSEVDPAGRFDLDEVDYQFIAGQQFGKADPSFEIVSRRGIGIGTADITIGGDVWTLSGAFDSAVYTGRSCTGIRGPWEITVSVPMIEETWSTTLEFDENLESRLTTGPTNGGFWVHPDSRFWLVPDGNDYIMHTEPEDAPLRMTRADPALCG